MSGAGYENQTAVLEDPPASTCSPFPKCRWPFFPENLSETVNDPAVGCLASPGGHLQSCLDNISRGHQRSSRHTFEEKKATLNPPKDFIHLTRKSTTVTTQGTRLLKQKPRRMRKEKVSASQLVACFSRIGVKRIWFSF